ncbi:MAG TPA: PspC domain-containing protein [Candidatus Limnocylindrales bacterium]|nr:PspC domain-containing protein [Candidatus Limnocylindrales bacterium]
MQVNRRLYRCRHNRQIAGVASGLAEYFDLDPTIVRVLWILSFFLGGVGLLLYIAMAIIVPLEPETGVATAGPAAGPRAGDSTGGDPAASPTDWHSMPATHQHASRGAGGGRAATFVGIALILFGALALVDTVLPAWADGGRFLWPAFIIGIGALLLATAVRREPTES